MVQMRMCQENVPDLVQVVERKVAYAGTGIEQNVVIDEHRGGAGPGTDSTTAAQNSCAHILATSCCSGGTRVLLNSTIWDD
jgi:hypothetical protein